MKGIILELIVRADYKNVRYLLKQDMVNIYKLGGTMSKNNTKSLEVSRYELKYPISFIDYARLSHLMRNMLLEDKNNKEHGYPVRSVYFDSIENTDFYEKMDGLENRKKIRLRTYEYDSNIVKLELKRKFGNAQRKQSLIVTVEDAKELLRCNYEVLKNYESDVADTLYNLMTINLVKPVVMIEYNRKAFIHPMNNIRITLDSDIRSSETDFRMFEKNVALIPINYDYFALLEVKYNGFIFKWISDILRGFELNQESYSKYSSSRIMFEEYLG